MGAEARRKAWHREQERLAKKAELDKMQAQGKIILPQLVDETYTGGPAVPLNIQDAASGRSEMHVGKTILDEYALVALRAWIERGAGVDRGGDGILKVDTDMLAKVTMETARSCIVQRRLVPVPAQPPAGELEPAEEPAPVDEIAAAKAEQAPAPVS